jgi:vitamin B12/bleomycin/antimicrobial peptide transport system ATP-binding/permease protein
VLENLNIALAGGRAVFEQSRVEVAPGEHVLIVAERTSDRSALLHALAGVLPWGAGTIHLPPRDTMMFMPPRPYLPLGTLRAGASYPAPPERFDHASVAAALARVGLCHLLLALDREERWDQGLSLEERQRLAFARLVLHRPRWVVLDDALGALDEDQRRFAAGDLRARAGRHGGGQHRALPGSQRLLRSDAAFPVRRGERDPSAPSPAPASHTATRLGSAT